MTPFSAPWRAALEEAWTAYTEDSLPIGASIADEHGTVLIRIPSNSRTVGKAPPARPSPETRTFSYSLRSD